MKERFMCQTQHIIFLYLYSRLFFPLSDLSFTPFYSILLTNRSSSPFCMVTLLSHTWVDSFAFFTSVLEKGKKIDCLVLPN